MCHQHAHGRHFGVTFWGLMPCQQYFRYIKVTYHRIELPVRSAGARENVPCSIAFLTLAITKPAGINPGASGWNILDWFQKKKIRNFEMYCSRTVSEQTFFRKQL